MTVPSAGWRAVYAECDVPAPDDRREPRGTENGPSRAVPDGGFQTMPENGNSSDGENRQETSGETVTVEIDAATYAWAALEAEESAGDMDAVDMIEHAAGHFFRDVADDATEPVDLELDDVTARRAQLAAAAPGGVEESPQVAARNLTEPVATLGGEPIRDDAT